MINHALYKEGKEKGKIKS